MIVKCEQCQTRFKIPDDKVTDRGVKVKCTKCGHTFRVNRQGQVSAAGPAAPAAPAPDDPFARFGAAAEPTGADLTKPGVFSLGVEATRLPELAPRPPAAALPPAPAPFDFGAIAPPAAAAAPFDFGSLAPPVVPAPRAPVPAPAAAPSPFDFSSLGPPPAPPAASPFNFGSLGPSPSPAPVAPPPPAASTGALAFDFSSLGPPPSAPPPAASPRPPPSRPPVAAPPPSAPRPAPVDFSASLLGDVPTAQDADDFFGTPVAAAPSPMPQGDTKDALFDMSMASTATPEPVPEQPAPAVAPVTSVGPAPVRLPPLPVPEARRRRTAMGVVVNLGIAAVLVVALVVLGSVVSNEGHLDARAFSVEHLKGLFFSSAPLVARDVTNGLYETRAGKAAFYVRGEVENRGEAPVRVKVRAELLEGDTLVRGSEVLAGGSPTPEEVHLLSSPEALAQLDARMARVAQPVSPGERVPFVVTFLEYPPDLQGFRVKVTVTPEPGAAGVTP
jgi:predicted Zn finger-like uncharacterized protein